MDAFAQSGNWSSELLTTKVIENSGHISFWERPGEFNAVVRRWADKALGRSSEHGKVGLQLLRIRNTFDSLQKLGLVRYFCNKFQYPD